MFTFFKKKKPQENASVNDQVIVPEGHKVVAMLPTKNPQSAMLASGVVILDYGEGTRWVDQNAKIETELRGKESRSVIVVLQQRMIEELAADHELEKLIAYWVRARDRGMGAIWVLPCQASMHKEVIDLLKGDCFDVYGSAEDGAYFIEVHKPDGSIVVGMSGPAL